MRTMICISTNIILSMEILASIDIAWGCEERAGEIEAVCLAILIIAWGSVCNKLLGHKRMVSILRPSMCCLL